MNLIKEGKNKGMVLETTQTRKLTIDGITSVYPVYKVKLECLYFNDKNDRIATWISRYKEEHKVEKLDISDFLQYNLIIHEFIKKSNEDAFKKTKNNISIMEQREPGVVLNDGRIIDGNRRYTCLRELAENNAKFGHFETVILNQNIENYEKQIKMLELVIQHGEEARVDYNPIDRLVGIYNDIIKNELLTEKEYANSINASISTVNKEVEVAKLMEDFLVFINAPEKFYIARDLAIDGPIRELQGALKKISDTTKQESIKNVVFSYLLMQPAKDMTRYVRQVKNISSSVYLEEFIEESLDVAEEILNELPEIGKVDANVLAKVRSNVTSADNLKRSMEKTMTKVHATETRNKPAQNLEQVLNILETIDTNIFIKLSSNQRKDIKELCEKITKEVKKIEDTLNV